MVASTAGEMGTWTWGSRLASASFIPFTNPIPLWHAGYSSIQIKSSKNAPLKNWMGGMIGCQRVTEKTASEGGVHSEQLGAMTLPWLWG